MNLKSIKLGPRWTLFALLAVCVLPVVAAYVAYYWLPPEGRTHNGELLPPRPAPLSRLSVQNPAALSGRWLLVTVDSASCDAPCQHKLWLMRQVRTAMGDKAHRVERLWLVTGDGEPDARLVQAFQGMQFAHVSADALEVFAADRPRADYIYLLDPRAQVIMRYVASEDPKGVIRDLERLLRYSSQ